jgi:anti-sigma B factor antagonist
MSLVAMASDPLIVERAIPEIGQGILVLKGPLTANNLHSLQNAIRREQTPTLILDLTEVPYIDSSGLGSLVSAYVSGHKSGQQVVLTGINNRVAKLFEITKLEPFFLIFPTIDDALEALSNPGQA